MVRARAVHLDSANGGSTHVAGSNLGLSINYTRFSSVDLNYGATLDKDSWGGALQVGVDVALSKSVYFNLDLKKVMIRTDVKVAGNKVGDLKVDPLLVGVGLGWRS